MFEKYLQKDLHYTHQVGFILVFISEQYVFYNSLVKNVSMASKRCNTSCKHRNLIREKSYYLLSDLNKNKGINYNLLEE